MIHQYKLGGYHIVLDVCSGSVHAVDEVAYEMIARYETEPRETLLASLADQFAHRVDVTPEDLSDCYDDITALKEQGKLFAPDVFEPMAGRLKEKTAGVVKALCLHIAHTCNLNCSYCFASQGKYHGERAVKRRQNISSILVSISLHLHSCMYYTRHLSWTKKR